MRILLMFILMAVIAAQALASDNHYESSSHDVVMIELFTSEGCSSCPPAERWLNHFTDSDGLWRDYYPVAWHVDYWDSLGWPDRFADSSYSKRQRRYKRQTELNSVYTPGLLVNGKAWRGWVASQEPPRRVQAGSGVLTVSVVDGEISAHLLNSAEEAQQEDYLLQAVILGFGLTTKVKRGENSGKKLIHEFVVLAHKTFGMSKTGWQGALPAYTDTAKEADRLAVVFWLETPGSPVPKKIAGGWLAF